jgi:hypothetical protein
MKILKFQKIQTQLLDYRMGKRYRYLARIFAKKSKTINLKTTTNLKNLVVFFISTLYPKKHL